MKLHDCGEYLRKNVGLKPTIGTTKTESMPSDFTKLNSKLWETKVYVLKKILFLSFVIMGILQVKAQSSSDLLRINTPQIIPSSPQSRVFERYVNHEINEYSGAPEITIPLYEIEIKGMKVPVTLTYDASGIKYKQYDGEIGAGWSLNIGGYRVSRTIHGKPDEKVPFYNLDTFNSVRQNAWQRDIYLAHINMEGSHQIVDAVNTYPNQNWICDGQYDQFTYNLPTTSGHFIITDRNTRSVDIMEQNQDKVYINQGNTPFHNMKITDSSGNNYLFSTSGQAEKTIVGTYAEETTWVMNKAVSTLNDSICFSYKEIWIRSNPEHSVTIMEIPYPYTSIPFGTGSDKEAEIILDHGVPDGMTTNFKSYYIDEIMTNKEIIKIHRRGESDFRHVIEKITVTDRFTNQILKTVVLRNNHVLTPPHLLLDGIEITGGATSSMTQRYQFDYYNYNSNINTLYPDQWGYYNQYAGVSLGHIFHSEFGEWSYERQQNTWSQISSTILPGHWRLRSENNLGENYFSLKKITYPTGGYSEYEYEPNRFSQGQGLGWRVKKITSTAMDSQKIITIFKYGKNENGTGNVNFSGFGDFLSFFVNRSVYVNRRYEHSGTLPPGVTLPVGIIYRIIKHFSQNPAAAEVFSSKVYYTHVTKYEYDDNQNKYNGKTLSIYDMPIAYYHQEYQIRPSLCNNSASFSNIGDLEIRRYYPGIHPVIQEKLYYDESGNKQKHDLFKYTTKTKTYEGLKAKQFIFYSDDAAGAAIGSKPKVYDLTNFLFSNMEYYIESRPQFPISQTNIQYIWQGNVLKDSLVYTENYEYNTKNQLVKTTQTNSTNGSLIKNYKYPHDYSVAPYPEMVTKNMVSPVIEQVTTNNNMEIGRIKTNYFKDAIKTNNLILPEKIQTSASGAAGLRTDITYDLYDSKGNPRQITTMDGISAVYLWSYNGQYPVAEIKNATFTAVNSALTLAGLASADALSSISNPDDTVINKLKSLRNYLPNSLITVYTYKPLVGMLTATDPRGVTTYYDYDTFGRLKETYIMENGVKKVIQNYNYHYKNQ